MKDYFRKCWDVLTIRQSEIGGKIDTGKKRENERDAEMELN